jgi:hypothetical protein
LSARKAVKVINGDDIPRMQRQAVAKKIAPYFHPKLKPVPPGAGAATILSTIAEGRQKMTLRALPRGASTSEKDCSKTLSEVDRFCSKPCFSVLAIA